MFFKSKIIAILVMATPFVSAAQPVNLLADTPFASEELVLTSEDTTEMEEAHVATILEEVPIAENTSEKVLMSATASYYGARFDGRRTANGERFDMNALTAAHKTLPFGTLVRVSYQGVSVVVRINDRGPFIKGRDIDLSQRAAASIGLIKKGHGPVTLQIL